jgi:drug/metabolite transporter (DMT)-like permease
MSHDEILAAVLALLAAFAAAVGNVIRQRSAQEVTDKEVGHLTLFSMLLRDKRWWIGGIGDISSYVFLAAALDKGSVLLVMSLQVTNLLFALPLYARVTRNPITRNEWFWAILLTASLAIVIAVGDPQGEQDRAANPTTTWLIVSLVLGPLMLLCLAGARIYKNRSIAAVLLAAVAGTMLAVFAVLMKGVIDILKHHRDELFTTPELYLWLFTGVAGMIFHQSAYRAGSLTASLPTIIAAKPLVGGVLGVLILEESIGATGPKLILLALAAVTVIVATVGLARGEAAEISAGEGRDRIAAQKAAAEALQAPPQPVEETQT